MSGDNKPINSSRTPRGPLVDDWLSYPMMMFKGTINKLAPPNVVAVNKDLKPLCVNNQQQIIFELYP